MTGGLQWVVSSTEGPEQEQIVGVFWRTTSQEKKHLMGFVEHVL